VDWRQRFRLFPNYFGRVIVVAWLNREKNPREVATVTTAKIGDAQNAVSTKQTPQKRVYVNCNSKHHMTILWCGGAAMSTDGVKLPLQSVAKQQQQQQQSQVIHLYPARLVDQSSGSTDPSLRAHKSTHRRYRFSLSLCFILNHFWARAIRWCHLNFSPVNPRCHGNEYLDKISYNSAPVKRIAHCLHLPPYFRARAIWRCHLNFFPWRPLLPWQRILGQNWL